MDILCPGCGARIAPSDDICPRCALVQAIPPAVPSTVPAIPERGLSTERRLPFMQDRDVQHSLRMLLAISVGLVLLLFAVVAVIVWLLFGM